MTHTNLFAQDEHQHGQPACLPLDGGDWLIIRPQHPEESGGDQCPAILPTPEKPAPTGAAVTLVYRRAAQAQQQEAVRC